jgi:hypothetical protein
LRIPEDISVAGYDGITLSQILEPKITTVKQDTGALGRSAAEKLIAMIENPKASIIERVVIEGKVLPGQTVCNLLIKPIVIAIVDKDKSFCSLKDAGSIFKYIRNDLSHIDELTKARLLLIIR